MTTLEATDADTGTVEVQPTSRFSAEVTDIVLRESVLVRLVFRPEIVENGREPQACVRGKFIYQKRAKGEPWSDAPSESLSALRKGASYQLLLKSGELLKLLRQLGALYRLHKAFQPSA